MKISIHLQANGGLVNASSSRVHFMAVAPTTITRHMRTVITGVVGLVPRPDDVVEVNPLLPADTWDWFCLDDVQYHGHTLPSCGTAAERSSARAMVCVSSRMDGKSLRRRTQLACRAGCANLQRLFFPLLDCRHFEREWLWDQTPLELQVRT
jgi:hypothetical protein